jgi:chemotaxis signal transduction protein
MAQGFISVRPVAGTSCTVMLNKLAEDFSGVRLARFPGASPWLVGLQNSRTILIVLINLDVPCLHW